MEIQSGAGASLMAQSLANETFGAQLVTRTLDHLNTNKSGSSDIHYEDNKAILQAGFMQKNSIVDKMV